MDSITDGAFVAIDDPALVSRVLYSNPVCFLVTRTRASPEQAGEEHRDGWRRNAMILSWLTPVNNSGDIAFSLSKHRFTAKVSAAADHARLFTEDLNIQW